MTHHLDYRVWPDHPSWMHAHSLLWLAVLVFGAGAFYRRILGSTWAAAIATWAYAVDDSHGLAASWLANRNGLIATALGIFALVAHDRWRSEGWKAGPYVTGALAWLSLQGGSGGTANMQVRTGRSRVR